MKKVAYPKPNLPKRKPKAVRIKTENAFVDGDTTDLHSVAHEAYKKAKAKANVTVNGLTPRQMKQHQKATAAVERWISRLTRAANEIAKHTKTIKRYERLIAKVAATK